MSQDVAVSADLMSPEAVPAEQERPRRRYSMPVMAFTQLTGSVLYERLVNGLLG